jgi:glycosyltransferase involved in cell wall biosynthesis
MIHGVPPWAPSGYGVQGALLAKGLRRAGHDIIYSAYGGFIHEGMWDDIPIIGCGGSSKGVGRIAHNYRRSAADVMITVCDLWPLDAREFDGLNVISWLPVDCHPLGMPDQIQLRAASEICARFKVVAMSEHGRDMLGAFGYDAPVIPHMVDPIYKPAPDRLAWRREHGIPEDAFLISTVGVNGDYPSRKAFPELLAAFQVFSEQRPEARLYMHTQISPGIEGVDLMQILKTLDMGQVVGFPDQLKRLADLFGPDYMAGMMRASDVGVFATMGEGFCVPAAEFQACGTPVIVSNCSALTERIRPGITGWLCATQPSWTKLHNAWWEVPRVDRLIDCMELAYGRARRMRVATSQQVYPLRPRKVIPQWVKALEEFK